MEITGKLELVGRRREELSREREKGKNEREIVGREGIRFRERQGVVVSLGLPDCGPLQGFDPHLIQQACSNESMKTLENGMGKMSSFFSPLLREKWKVEKCPRVM